MVQVDGKRQTPGVPRGYSFPVKKQRRTRPEVLVFCVVAALAYAASIIWLWVVDERTWMWVDVIVFPFIVLMAFSVIFGDRTPDGSTDFLGDAVRGRTGHRRVGRLVQPPSGAR
ncbi:hypothetical protein GCM10010207_69430 [Streptomyces atratus]|nr:hypothetical protein GCM10010207_69430 [Streptomyces atratus]